MKLECMDRTSLETDTYWVATVVMASGPLLLLRHDGYEDDRSGDFWCDAASEDLQPVGWCARTNNILIPPAGRFICTQYSLEGVGGTPCSQVGYKGRLHLNGVPFLSSHIPCILKGSGNCHFSIIMKGSLKRLQSERDGG